MSQHSNGYIVNLAEKYFIPSERAINFVYAYFMDIIEDKNDMISDIRAEIEKNSNKSNFFF